MVVERFRLVIERSRTRTDIRLTLRDASAEVGVLEGRIDVPEAHIRLVSVKPKFRGKGLGKRLVEAFERMAKREGSKRISLNALEDSIDFWSSLDFEETGELESFDGFEGFEMVKHIRRRPSGSVFRRRPVVRVKAHRRKRPE